MQLVTISSKLLRCKIFLRNHVYQQCRVLSRNLEGIINENVQCLEELGFSKKNHSHLYKRKMLMSSRFQTKIDVLQRLGFTKNDITLNWDILKVKARVIDNRFKMLEEGGFYKKKITIDKLLFNKYSRLVAESAQVLKEENLIDKKTDVTRSVLQYSDLPPELYPDKADDLCSFCALEEIAVKTYLCWKLNLKKEELEKRCAIYKLYGPYSIQLLKESYNFMVTEVGLSNYTIMKNTYLMRQHPNDMKELLERVPMIGEVPIRSVMAASPKALTRSFYHLLEILEVLEDYNISSQGVALYPRLLTLSPNTVRERLQLIKADPQLSLFLQNPSICKIVLYYNLVNRRIKKLKEMKWRCNTLYLLSTFTGAFKGRLKMGSDLSKGNDMVIYLYKELNMIVNPTELRQLLKKNPFWRYVPLSTVSATLHFLLQQGFTPKQILENLTVILYPQSNVEKQVLRLASEPEVNSCREPESGQVQHHLILPLVLYYLERPYHFNGSGVWGDELQAASDASKQTTIS